jgi:hypothetical protein
MGRKGKFRSFAVIAAAMSLLALSATAALAQYPTPPEDGVSCTDAEPGGTSECAVGGAEAGEVLSWTASSEGDEFASGTETADETGSAFFSVEIPTEVLGEVHVRVTGDQGFEAEATINAEADEDEGTPVTEDDADDDADEDTLPITGGQIALLLALAVGLIAVGTVATRKKDKATTEA